MNKKILIGLAFLVLLFFIGGVLWFSAQKKTVQAPGQQPVFPPQEQEPSELFEQQLENTRAAAEIINEKVSFPPESKVVEFRCDEDPITPSCNGVVDVKSWDEYADVVRGELMRKIKDAGIDPCKVLLMIAVTDKTLHRSYDESKDPLVQDCR